MTLTPTDRANAVSLKTSGLAQTLTWKYIQWIWVTYTHTIISNNCVLKVIDKHKCRTVGVSLVVNINIHWEIVTLHTHTHTRTVKQLQWSTYSKEQVWLITVTGCSVHDVVNVVQVKMNHLSLYTHTHIHMLSISKHTHTHSDTLSLFSWISLITKCLHSQVIE